jgi:hypothetical protein
MRIESQGTKNFKKFMLKAKKINYSKNLKNLKNEFKLDDRQYDLLYRYLIMVFCKPTIQVYIGGSEIPHIKKNIEKANQIYLYAQAFVSENKILLNQEIID